MNRGRIACVRKRLVYAEMSELSIGILDLGSICRQGITLTRNSTQKRDRLQGIGVLRSKNGYRMSFSIIFITRDEQQGFTFTK